MPVVDIDFNKSTSDEKNKYSDMFCEGSKTLKFFLLFLWDNNIKTYGCCIGHGTNELDTPYIALDVDNIKKTNLQTILEICYLKFFEKIEISAIISKRKDYIRRLLSIKFKCFDNAENEKFFQILHEIFKNNINNKCDKLTNNELTTSTKTYINDLINMIYLDKEKFCTDNLYKEIYEIQLNNQRILIKNNLIKDTHLVNIENRIWASGERDNTLKWNNISKYIYYKINDNEFLVANKSFDGVMVVDKNYIINNKLKDAIEEFEKSHIKYSHNKFNNIFKF